MAGWGTLFWHIGVFLFITFVVYLVCLQFIRLEDKRTQRYGPRR